MLFGLLGLVMLTLTPGCGDDSGGGDGECGNGLLESGEACDGADLGGESCQSQGFNGGTLACTDSCTLDTSACSSAMCGDDSAEGTEVCDGADLGGETCEGQGFDGGSLACAADCMGYDSSGCYACGDDAVGGMEACDGADLDGESCASQGFDGGSLACVSDCSGFDTSGCYACGDGAIEGPEVCDGSNLSGEDCMSQGFDGGTLGCANDCSGYDTSGCYACGDGARGGPEVCDGSDLGGETCQSLGYLQGTLACNMDCGSFDTSGCLSLTYCSNPALPIGPDGGTLTTDTLTVPALGQYVTDVNVYIDANHTYVGDLEIRIRHVNSDTTVLLADNICGTVEDIDATFDQDATALPDCVAPLAIDGSVLPVETLDRYLGMTDATGIWELTIFDSYLGDGGTLNGWCVEFEVSASVPPETCGDGVTTFGEECDDGNLVNGDGCDDTCLLEPGYDCTYEVPGVCTCVSQGVSALRLTAMSIGTDWVEITNTGCTPVTLDGLNILFDDSSFTDRDFVFPAGTGDIQSGQTLRIFEPGGAGDISTGSNIFFDISRGGAALLCTGTCATSAEVLDVVAFSEGEPHPTLPTGVTFAPAGLSGMTNQNTEIYTRVDYSGVTPAFLAADWAIQ